MDDSYVSLYVGDLHPDVNEEQLTDAFNEFKTLTSVHICRDFVSGRSLCYGYVNFVSPQDGMLILFFIFYFFIFYSC